GPCQICTKGPEKHRALETSLIAEKATKLNAELRELFKSASDDAARRRVARTRDGGATWSGYMVGVISCKCTPPKYFCTNSGATMPGLHDAARAVGGLEVIDGGPAAQTDFVNANKSTLPRAFKA